MEKDLNDIVFSKNVVEFVAVAVQFCGYLENTEDEDSQRLIDWASKILPLLYLKASMLPEEVQQIDEEDVEVTVTEESYTFIYSKLLSVIGKDDDYLEVFMEDMKYSDTPITASISEDLTDIYQDVKNFITVYERGVSENMNDALYLCTENFKLFWGQKLVNVLRAIHALKYSVKQNEDFDDFSTNNEDDLW